MATDGSFEGRNWADVEDTPSTGSQARAPPDFPQEDYDEDATLRTRRPAALQFANFPYHCAGCDRGEKLSQLCYVQIPPWSTKERPVIRPHRPESPMALHIVRMVAGLSENEIPSMSTKDKALYEEYGSVDEGYTLKLLCKWCYAAAF